MPLYQLTICVDALRNDDDLMLENICDLISTHNTCLVIHENEFIKTTIKWNRVNQIETQNNTLMFQANLMYIDAVIKQHTEILVEYLEGIHNCKITFVIERPSNNTAPILIKKRTPIWKKICCCYKK